MPCLNVTQLVYSNIFSTSSAITGEVLFTTSALGVFRVVQVFTAATSGSNGLNLSVSYTDPNQGSGSLVTQQQPASGQSVFQQATVFATASSPFTLNTSFTASSFAYTVAVTIEQLA